MVSEAFGGEGVCSLVLADVARFKRFNDTHGHRAGDYVLKELAAQLRDAAPRGAMAARYGGEEFVLLLPGLDAAGANRLAERIRRKLDAAPLVYEGIELHVTASFGVAECPTHARTPSDLVQRADEALYAAKAAGRNRVCVSDPIATA